MSRHLLAAVSIAAAGCSSAAPPPPDRPGPVAPTDAATAAPPPDAPDEVGGAPAWVFRFHTKDRTETWTLRFTAGRALLVVETAQGAQRYTGTATDGSSLAIDVSTGTAKLALDCKRVKRPLGAVCNDARANPIEVLDCYVPDFATPMPFAPAPGVEYVSDERCTGYRLLPQPMD